jgi:hypothetical protein
LNLSVRAFSDTVRTTLSGAPSGNSASISNVTLTRAHLSCQVLDHRLPDLPGVAPDTICLRFNRARGKGTFPAPTCG